MLHAEVEVVSVLALLHRPLQYLLCPWGEPAL